MEENNENLTEIYNDNQDNQDNQDNRSSAGAPKDSVQEKNKLCFNSSKKSTT